MRSRLSHSLIAAGATFLIALIAPCPGDPWQGAFPEGVDAFRILLVTSETVFPVSSDITWYDTYISDRVDAVPELAAVNTTWKCLGSTAAAAAKTHTQTDPVVNGAGVPIYRTDGTLFATDNAQLWSGAAGSGLDPFYNEWGVCEYYFEGTGGDEQYGNAWTGSTGDGAAGANPLGSAQVTVGQYTGPAWFSHSPWPTNALPFPVYGISGVIRASDIPPAARETETFIARLQGPSPTRITDLSADGILSWSNAVAGGICTVEVATALGQSNGQWNAFTAIRTSNTFAEARVRDPSVPERMALIPGGTFRMGDSLDEGARFELPVHEVTVTEFWMDQTETSNDDMVELLNWANAQGRISIEDDIYVYAAVGQHQVLLTMSDWWSRIAYDGTNFFVRNHPNGEGHPVVNVSWWGAIHYCNWRSEVGGLDPCYDLQTPSCDWEKTGYRLPTEAEWERAARGGHDGARFPSGNDTISHHGANYYSRWDSWGEAPLYPYDEAASQGYHPTYVTYGGWTPPVPLTAPVLSMPFNGYRLYHMAGNVREWCWDKNDVQANDPHRYYYEFSPALNPRGADGPSYLSRIYRGAGWSQDSGVTTARCSSWGHGPWQRCSADLGFRTVRRRLLPPQGP